MYIPESCKIWFDRLPYATFFGFCISGIGIIMLIVTKNDFIWENLRATKGYFERKESSSSVHNDVKKGNKMLLALSCSFLGLSVLVLMMGFMANGDFRARIFRTKVGRIFGVLTCGFLALLTAASICWWLHHAGFYTKYYLYTRASEIECDLAQYRNFFGQKCMVMAITNVLLDEEGLTDFRVCDTGDKFRYCNLYLPLLKSIFLRFYLGFCFVVAGQVIYCMCMAANYVKIRSQDKFQELADLRSLELDLGSKDRL